MAAFTGTLNSNEIFGAIYNMIISQQVFADNIAGTSSELVDASRVDGTLYGDQKLYYATDVLESTPWGADLEAPNLLALHRPAAPSVQAIVLNVFRQISLTVDNYLTKRAWSTEGAFSSFNSVMMGWIGETKRIYDATNYNTFIGNTTASGAGQNISITLSGITATGEEKNRLEAQMIAEAVANLMVALKDPSRTFNDYGYMRSYDVKSLRVVWNSAWYNKITKLDLPTIFHKEGLMDKFGEYVLPAKYFGTINGSSGTTTASNTTVRSLIETDYGATHVFPGELLPNSQAYLANETYTEDADIICKVMHDDSVPYMSAFEVGTSFFNAKALVESHFLTFGRNTLEYLKNYPFITIEAN